VARLYTQRLLAGAVTATTYTAECPEGFLWVIRDVILVWNGSSDPSVEIYSLTITPEVYVILYGVVGSDGPHVVEHWQGRQVVEAGETLEFGSTTDTFYVLVTGYALSLP